MELLSRVHHLFYSGELSIKQREFEKRDSRKQPGRSSGGRHWSSWTYSCRSSASALCPDLCKSNTMMRRVLKQPMWNQKNKCVFSLIFFKSPRCCFHLQTAPVRSTSECSSACTPAAGSSRCPASISDRRTSACPWSDPGGCWGIHSRPRLKGQDGCCFLTNTKGEEFIFSTQIVKMYKKQ